MATKTFFFYDLETSGINPREQRIMQFAGQRTDLNLKPIGEPENILIKLTGDVVPEPDAIMITGITPQQTLAEGISEVEFLKHFTEHIATAGTIFVGYNTVRFDDEFMRYLHYRNFYDPYEWQWRDDRSRWDILDVVRMTRALRPDGITWPFAPDGKPSNRLELLTNVNGLDHQAAHDALSDVHATIALATLIRNKQQKLFEYLLSVRDKKSVAKLAESGEAFVYSSGQYPAEYEKTTVVVMAVKHPQQGAFVYDLRHDPTQYAGMSAAELAKLWEWKRDSAEPRLPVKLLQYNRCPAVAPLGVLDAASQERLKLSLDDVRANASKLKALLDNGFGDRLLEAASMLEGQRQTSFLAEEKTVDAQLYDGFFDEHDRTLERALRVAEPSGITDVAADFRDPRLRTMAPLYKARNFADSLSGEELVAWEVHRAHRLMDGGTKSRLARYFARLGELASQSGVSGEKQFLLEELQLYGQSILPADATE